MVHSARTQSSDGAKVNILNSTFDGIYLIVKFGEIKEARMVKKGCQLIFPAFLGCLLELSSEMSRDLIETDGPSQEKLIVILHPNSQTLSLNFKPIFLFTDKVLY